LNHARDADLLACLSSRFFVFHAYNSKINKENACKNINPWSLCHAQEIRFVQLEFLRQANVALKTPCSLHENSLPSSHFVPLLHGGEVPVYILGAEAVQTEYFFHVSSQTFQKLPDNDFTRTRLLLSTLLVIQYF
jgi:hypothetical protein